MTNLHISRDDLSALIREAVSDAFRDVGLHAGKPELVDEIRADFRFIRSLRKSIERTAGKVVTAVLVTLTGGGVAALWIGIRQLAGVKT
jgi:hypothetical protein